MKKIIVAIIPIRNSLFSRQILPHKNQFSFPCSLKTLNPKNFFKKKSIRKIPRMQFTKSDIEPQFCDTPRISKIELNSVFRRRNVYKSWIEKTKSRTLTTNKREKKINFIFKSFEWLCGDIWYYLLYSLCCWKQ